MLISSVTLFAEETKSVDELKFYINAGHGGWGRDDRPMSTKPFPKRYVEFTDYTCGYGETPTASSKTTYLPDTCGFFESNTNLWKCEALYETLIKMGASSSNIKMSREINGPYPQSTYARYDNEISKFTPIIAGEAEEFAPDLFISIHSDAGANSYGSTYNYDNHVLFLYRGHDAEGGDLSTGSREIAYALWDKHFMDEIDYMSPNITRTNTNIRGDFDFYGSGIDITNNIYSGIAYEGYLGVLKHGYPGVLVEGFCHSYEPEAHRALNRDFCRQEGVRLARGICDYFNMNPETTGYIMGTVKDKNNTPPFTYYNSGEDSYLPINGAVVKLYKGSQLIDIYPTDEFYNGIFLFENLEPANDYYINVVADGYASLSNQGPFTVVANETTYPKLYMTESSSSTITASDLEVNIEQEFTDRNISVLEGKTIRRSILHDGMLYVLAVDNSNNPFIYTINPDTQSATAISTTGVTDVTSDNNQGSRLYTISDIAITSDGKLIACNQEQCQFNDSQVGDGYNRGIFRVYKWESINGTPSLWFSSQASANWLNADVGNTLTFSGTSTSGKLITTATTSGSSRGIRLISFNIHNNQMVETIINKSESLATAVSFGENYQLTSSDRHRDFVILNGSLHSPIEMQVNTVDANLKTMSFTGTVENPSNAAPFLLGTLKSDDLISTGGNLFAHEPYSIYVTPNSNDASNNTGIALYTATAGLSSAEIITSVNASLDAYSSTYTMADGYSDGTNIVIYLLRDNMLSKWSATATSQPIDDLTTPKGIFAYGLSSSANADGTYTFQFTANYNSTNAALVFYDSDSQNEIGRVAIDNVVEGQQNTLTLSQSEIPGNIGQVLNWGVYLKAKNIGEITKLNADNEIYNYTRIGIAVDNSTESDHFGQFYVINRISSSSSYNGLWGYNQDYTLINNSVLTGGQTLSNPTRLATDMNGKIYISEWGDSNSGIYIVSPDNLTGTFSQFFVGSRASSGLITNNNTNVGSSVSGVEIGGTGSSTKLYALMEDFPQKNCIAVYNIGQSDGSIATSWNTSPSSIIDVSSLMANGNSQIVSDKYGGIWVSQNRSNGYNTNTVPSLIHINSSGTVDFNSGNDLSSLNGSVQGGFAMNRDNTLLCISDGQATIQIYEITWNETDPTLTWKMSLSHSSGSYVQQMDFDWGGNLYVAGSSLGIYSIPTNNNESTVPAKLSLTVTKTSLNKTLAQLVNDDDVVVGNTYTIADEYLTCVYVAKDNRTIFCKDDNGYVNKSIKANSQRDFIAEHFNVDTHDQSNWIAITLPRELTQADGELAGYTITDITGTLNDLDNPALTAITMPTQLNAKEYTPNTYITCNFVSENWDNESFFFVKPKPNEYAFVTWALWDDSNNAFLAPAEKNQAQLTGGFYVDLSLLDYQNLTDETLPSDIYIHGSVYQFNAIVKSQSAISRIKPKATGISTSISDMFTVYPITFDASSVLPTALNEIKQNKADVVKTEYYNINGILTSCIDKSGIYIKKQYLSDGTIIATKIVKK